MQIRILLQFSAAIGQLRVFQYCRIGIVHEAPNGMLKLSESGLHIAQGE